MVVIFPKCAILPIKSSMLRGAVCSQCDSAFRVQKLSYYSNYRHGSCFQMLNSFMDMGDKYENQYPDLQFTRFGDLCINCRAPYIGEGNFEVSSLDIEGLSAQGANVGLAGVITNLIYDYYTKRVFPEFKLYPDPELAASPAIQIINNELLYIHKDVMSMPGVEHVFWGEMAQEGSEYGERNIVLIYITIGYNKIDVFLAFLEVWNTHTLIKTRNTSNAAAAAKQTTQNEIERRKFVANMF